MSSLEIVIYACIWMISISLQQSSVECVIGINWGRQSVTSLVPSMAVDLLLQNQIKEVKLFNSDANVIRAFAGTDIAVSLTIASESAVADEQAVRNWVARTISPFPTVKFKYVCVGNNAFRMAKFTSIPLAKFVERVGLVQRVIDDLGYGEKIKVVITHSASGVLAQNISMPSRTEFSPDVMEPMLEALKLLNQTGAPFIYETFPIAQVNVSQLDYDFAFADRRSRLVITDDNGLRYTNLFDLVHDSFIWALRKAGYGHMSVVAGMVGWPTDGYPGADVASAERYWKALLPKVTSNRGTPMRPGTPIDVFIHSLTDETNNPANTPFSRHWGVYWANGSPKYKIDLSGQGRDMYPATVDGITTMPTRWCVFNGNLVDTVKVRQQFDFACKYADCTALAPGGSCGGLTYMQNVSYAFNAYFQSRFQAEAACQFEDLGMIVLDNPSKDGCVFSIEVVKGNQPAIFLSTWNGKL